MITKVPPISESDIKHLSNEQSFQRGTNYYSGGALFDLVRQGNELRAYCEGSSYETYRISVELGTQGVESIHCTCPYDWGGICKHSVALLLTWVRKPDSFHTVQPLDEMLANRTKEELIILIKEMLKRAPDLTRLLELSVQPDRQTPLNLDAFRRQIDYALHLNDDCDYRGAQAVATELSALVDNANRFYEGSDWANAGALYALVLNEVVPSYEEIYDEDGDVSTVLQDCAEGLGKCLAEESDADTRREWLEALLEVELKDIEMGGIDLAYPAPDIIINQATNEEWTWIEQRVRRAIAAQSNRYSDFGQEVLVRFLARRLEARGQENRADELVLDLGSPQQQAFMLIEHQWFDEAVAIAKTHFSDLPGLVTRFADALVEADAGLTAETYIAVLLNTRYGTTYLDWLANYAEKTGDLSGALQRWQESFTENPSFKTYQTLRDVARQLGQWETLQPNLLAQLESQEKWPILIEIALDEAAIPRALEFLPKIRWGNYDLQVAQAAETDYPQDAIRIYCHRVEKLIAVRGRENYREATRLLVKVQNLYQKLGEQDTWQQYLIHIRLENSNLRALQDELNKAGLP